MVRRCFSLGPYTLRVISGYRVSGSVMTRLHDADGGVTELDPDKPSVDIRRLKLEVLKNAFCLAVFAGLGGYSLASRHNIHNTALSTVFYITTALGLMFFIPRLAWTTWKFLESNAKPDYQEVEVETYSV
jgi:hypothetical protein